MAGSKTPASNSGSLPEALLHPLQQIWPDGATAVAFSAGADSAMLALAADQLARARHADLYLLHVHHGLLPQADAWSEHAHAFARLIDRPLTVLRVDVGAIDGRGIEAAARQARYDALRQACGALKVQALWLAHHQDDQAETVLLRLLRGAGVAGMGAMRTDSVRDGLRLLRPWLGVPRQTILGVAADFAQTTGWAAVQDPTNVDPRYTRAAVRTRLSPVLEARWPGWQAIVARHARQAEEAAGLLDELAADDMAAIQVVDETDKPEKIDKPGIVGKSGRVPPYEVQIEPIGPQLALVAWRGLSPARQRNVLRHWLSRVGVRMPSDARLAELQRQLTQLHGLGHDRNLQWDHGAVRIKCVRGTILAIPKSD